MPAAVLRKPDWLKVRMAGGETHARLKAVLRSRNLHTVCEEARCPNMAECWGGGTATMMLLGDTCTRGCRFCAVSTGRPQALDPREPEHVAETVADLGLTYLVLTSVNRDDLPDGGAGHFAAAVAAIRRRDPEVLVEVLIPDFQGDRAALETLAASRPHVVAHNVETVRRLTEAVRDPRATYDQSLAVLRAVKEIDARLLTKSSIMLGLGETRDEVRATMADLRANGVDVVTLGQYLQPTQKKRHLPVVEYIHPTVFDDYRREAETMGFLYAASGPLVRSSYRAGEFFIEAMLKRGLRGNPKSEIRNPKSEGRWTGTF